jgi:Fis family transcriptional regulator
MPNLSNCKEQLDRIMTRTNEPPLAEYVKSSLERYLADLNGERPCALYEFVVREVEVPLLEVVMHHANSNQTRAAEMLGINRNTLRKKLKSYGLC